jgi:hypothetical protein
MRAIVLVALLAGVASAEAKDPVIAQGMRGKMHLLTIPAGWTPRFIPDGVAFLPPAGKTVSCAIFAADRKPDMTAATLVNRLAAEEIAQRKPYARVINEAQVNVGNMPGSAVYLRGSTAEGQDVLMAIVVAEKGDLVYVFQAEGLHADLTALSADVDRALAGVKLIEDTPPPPVKPVVRGLDPTIVDPLWGVSVKGLAASWRLKIEGDRYVLIHGSPQAAVTLRRVPLDAARKEMRGARPGKLAGADVSVLDGTADGAPQRTFYLVRGDHALAVGFASVTFDEALGLHLPVLEKALAFSAPTLTAGKKGGFTVAMPFGVELVTAPAPWRVDPARIGAASLTLQEPTDGITLHLRASSDPSEGDDPFLVDLKQFQTTCQTRKGTYDEMPVAVVGGVGLRLRCRNAHFANGDPMAALMYRAVGKRAGKWIHVLVTAFYETPTGATPDRAVADLLQYLHLPQDQ